MRLIKGSLVVVVGRVDHKKQIGIVTSASDNHATVRLAQGVISDTAETFVFVAQALPQEADSAEPPAGILHRHLDGTIISLVDMIVELRLAIRALHNKK